MSRANTPWQPVTAADLQWDDAANPVAAAFGDVYYSRDNGLEESRYVFLLGNQLPQRWQLHPEKHFCIGETGFGTGLNFLLTWQAWRDLPQPRPRLHYLSIEKFPLSRADLARALGQWPALQSLASQLQQHYPGLLPGQHRLQFEDGDVTLDLWWEDAGHALPQLASLQLPLVDAWYLDGFAPARNEGMWRREVLQAIGQLCRDNATFATFTAAGQVRRDLGAAGFTVEKVPGFGRKRECLRGTITRERPAPAPAGVTPWDLPAQRRASPEQVLVIGGGLAGCHTAYALARRGIAVTLLEQSALAAEGSGNEQGILYTRLSLKHSALTDFALQSFRYASALYFELLQNNTLREGHDGALCGSFHQSDDAREMEALAGVLETVPELARVLDAGQANTILGIAQTSGGYWFPASGWLSPLAVCRALAAHPNISVMQDCGKLAVRAEDGCWQALRGDQIVAQARNAVIATGNAANQVRGLEWLPLQPIRGQTTDLASGGPLKNLRAALCHKGYIAPARNGEHCIGATFGLKDPDSRLREEDHRENLARLAAAVPDYRGELSAMDTHTLGGRVGYRCATPDYLPLVGAVPERQAFLRDYGQLRKNARQIIHSTGEYVPGLYLNTGHGSRGLTSTPIAAEMLASQLCGEPPPLDRELCRALAPARFLLRDLSRNRI